VSLLAYFFYVFLPCVQRLTKKLSYEVEGTDLVVALQFSWREMDKRYTNKHVRDKKKFFPSSLW
jgi:hypothetical protein